ncbi:MAG: MaoC family dehydratase [Bacillota bacterium]
MRFQIGDKASMAKTISETDVYLFAGITGDLNPAHVNEVWAKNTKFGGRIAHGMLSAGLISAVLAMKLPGPGTIYLGQTLKFTAPVRIGDTVTAEVEVVEIIENKRLRMRTTATNQDGVVVLEGEALVLPPRGE